MKSTALMTRGLAMSALLSAVLIPAAAMAQTSPAAPASAEYESNADTAWQSSLSGSLIRGKKTNDPVVNPLGWQPVPAATPAVAIGPRTTPASPDTAGDVTRTPGPIKKSRKRR
jgi:hypothetical protein